MTAQNNIYSKVRKFLIENNIEFEEKESIIDNEIKVWIFANTYYWVRLFKIKNSRTVITKEYFDMDFEDGRTTNTEKETFKSFKIKVLEDLEDD